MELVTEYRATASHPILPLDATYPTLGQAAKAWDGTLYRLRFANAGGIKTQGGIQRRVLTPEGDLVSETWILHLFDGVVYLNPNLVLIDPTKEA